MRSWITKNREWLFSGILVYLVGVISAEARKHLPVLGATFNVAIWHLLVGAGILISVVSLLFIRKVKSLTSKTAELRTAVAESDSKPSLAEIDPLTGLHNLRRLDRFFSEELPLLEAARTDVWGIMLDIDKFRTVSEPLSVIEASDLLEEVGSRWKTRDEGDIIMRWGGDEFLAFAPGSTESGAIGFAKRLQRILSESPLYAGDQNHRIDLTATAGISRWNSKTDTDRSFQERLGKALDEAKQEGSPFAVL